MKHLSGRLQRIGRLTKAKLFPPHCQFCGVTCSGNDGSYWFLTGDRARRRVFLCAADTALVHDTVESRRPR